MGFMKPEDARAHDDKRYWFVELDIRDGEMEYLVSSLRIAPDANHAEERAIDAQQYGDDDYRGFSANATEVSREDYLTLMRFISYRDEI
jgi:hypothetical protein